MPASTPTDPNHKLKLVERDSNKVREMYQRIVEKLIYLSHAMSKQALHVLLVL